MGVDVEIYVHRSVLEELKKKIETGEEGVMEFFDFWDDMAELMKIWGRRWDWFAKEYGVDDLTVGFSWQEVDEDFILRMFAAKMYNRLLEKEAIFDEGEIEEIPVNLATSTFLENESEVKQEVLHFVRLVRKYKLIFLEDSRTLKSWIKMMKLDIKADEYIPFWKFWKEAVILLGNYYKER